MRFSSTHVVLTYSVQCGNQCCSLLRVSQNNMRQDKKIKTKMCIFLFTSCSTALGATDFNDDLPAPSEVEQDAKRWTTLFLEYFAKKLKLRILSSYVAQDNQRQQSILMSTMPWVRLKSVLEIDNFGHPPLIQNKNAFFHLVLYSFS